MSVLSVRRAGSFLCLVAAFNLLSPAFSNAGDETPSAPSSPPEAAQTLTAKPVLSQGREPRPVKEESLPGYYLLRNQQWVEGLRSTEVDLENIDATFWHIFSQLPDRVFVYPTENYYYFILYANRRQVWGNIRLPAWERDKGILSFAYFEFVDFPKEGHSSFTKHKNFGPEDGLIINKKDRFTYELVYKEKRVIFELNQIAQEPPKLFPLHSDEQFVQRTFDESGFQFFLLFNTTKNYFFWVLNEEAPVPDILEPITDHILLGRLSGFAFFVDKAHGGRKVFASISRSHGSRNDYFDGPFDQSADNYAVETEFQKYIELAYPYTKGNIDEYGNLVKLESQRVGITTYYLYESRADLIQFIAKATASGDPYQYISNSRKELFGTPPAKPVAATTPPGSGLPQKAPEVKSPSIPQQPEPPKK